MAIWAAGLLSVAHAQSNAPHLSGRWSSERLRYAMDIVRCGAKWCGVRINADMTCGAQVMELVEAPPVDGRPEWTGTLALDPGAPTYNVRVVGAGPRPQALSIIGGTGNLPNPLTRVIPFHDRLARDGDATCRAGGKTS